MALYRAMTVTVVDPIGQLLSPPLAETIIEQICAIINYNAPLSEVGQLPERSGSS